MTDQTGTSTYTCDTLGRLKTQTTPKQGTTTWVYDITTGLTAGHSAIKETDPTGQSLQKEFDKQGRLVKVIDDTDTML